MTGSGWFVVACTECGQALGGLESEELADSYAIGQVRNCPRCSEPFSRLSNGRRWNYSVERMARPPGGKSVDQVAMAKGPQPDTRRSVKEKCVRCDTAWERPAEDPRRACPRCGEVDFDHEFNLDAFLGSMEYEVVEERVDPHQIMTLELVWPLNRSNRTSAVLSHRLKSMYRHQKGDLSVKDGRELLVRFEKPASGPNAGLWVIHARRRSNEAARMKAV